MCRNGLNLIALSFAFWGCTDAATVGKENGDGSETGAGGFGQAGNSSSGVAGSSMGLGGAQAVGGSSAAGASNMGGAQTVGGSSAAGTSNVAGGSGAASIAQRVFGDCGFNITQPLSSSSLTFPVDFATATPNVFWDQLTTACSQGGWDVAACAGKDVIAVTGITDQVVTVADGNHPISVSAWIAGDKVCCLDGATDMPGALMSEKCDAKVLAQRTLDACKVSHSGAASALDIDVPAALTGPNWSIKAEQCSAGGWDLSECAGTTATFTSFAIGSSATTDQVWVVSKNDKVCCVYASTNSNPGIFSVTCQK